jgi:EmrB/QacA subfamily drug resistance transporter
MSQLITQNQAPPVPVESDRLSRRAWGTLLVLCGALFLDALDVSMIGVALPSIRTDLNLSTDSLQWIVSAYVLGYGGFLLLGGRAADLLGRRRVFLISLAVFLVASGLGGIATGAGFLIATRFIKGVSAAFTAPAGFSIITTSFPEGAARNKALAVYTATGATGFSLGLVFGGLLTEIGWRWVFFVPVVVSAIVLAAATRLVPASKAPDLRARSFDLPGAVGMTGAMLLLVYTLVEASSVGWGSARTLASFVASALLIAAFVAWEQRTRLPLVRLGILRSAPLVRANLAAMALFGSWVGFQFILTLYLQQLRGWSSLETGLAIFPAGLIVAILASRIAPIVGRFGVKRLIIAGLTMISIAYALFLPIGLNSAYVTAMLPTFILAGIGFGLAFGPVNIAAVTGVAGHEQGLAGGLINTSFQFGGALVLAVVTAVNNANTGVGGSGQALLDGFHPAIAVSLAAALLGVLAMAIPGRRRALIAARAEETETELADDLAFEIDAA